MYSISHANEKNAFTNRLIREASPYLQQHAHNPINWYAWGDDAFEVARKQNKPIFLSVGYATCHWCHVMEEESFENLEIAKILNENYIAIKVDRERRPEIDDIYMKALFILKGSGGWPMNLVLTPKGEPIVGETYLPKDKLQQMLLRMSQLWNTKQEALTQNAQRLHRMIQETYSIDDSKQIIDQIRVKKAVEAISRRYDDVGHGFGLEPKFPNELYLDLLLEYQKHHFDLKRQEIIDTTLKSMAYGAIYDQLGGGFHRYATDRYWNVPHFEKMLYTQAQMSKVYINAYLLSGNTLYKNIAKETLDFTLHVMHSKEGEFYSASDADSEGEEGRFFIWNKDEIKKSLDSEDANMALSYFNIGKEGALYRVQSLKEFAVTHNISMQDAKESVRRIRQKLYETRSHRIAPQLDTKVILGWNAMFVESLILGYQAFNELKYLQAAQRSMEYLWKVHRKKEGTFWRISLHQKGSIPALLQDYSAMANASITLYDVTQKPLWLERAKKITDLMITLFWDDKEHGFFTNETENSTLFQYKSSADAVVASGNAMAFKALIQLSKRIENLQYSNKADQTLALFSQSISSKSLGHSAFLKSILKIKNYDTIQYAGNGHVRIEVKSETSKSIKVLFHMAPKWHINSHFAKQEYLKKTEVFVLDDSWTLIGSHYPEGKKITLSHSKETLSLYEDDEEVSLFVKQKEASSHLKITVSLQACSFEKCLAPETLNFIVPHLESNN